MTHFDEIYEIAADNYGLVTAAQAKETGVVGAELNRYVQDGRLTKIGHGLYKLTRYIPTDYDAYAEAVAHLGEGAYLYGDAVLAMHNLGFVNPRQIKVATDRRVRKTLPAWIKPVKPEVHTEVVFDNGIPAQSVTDAIITCKKTVMTDRLLDAIHDAQRQHLLYLGDFEKLKEEFHELEDAQ
ncbi:MAG: type IV toxin-antitoxin system AbiEi family antitoxin domain-containing protein [Eggerthellaceae bacterium]|nr:type IV toxin-antitoxin system AbiEi family antitoxin domain-containing protein [Eggerthellaceae bacterium]MBQ9022009.1 type IV toxin-antitoxin system AbiEi family antitoxin domain-containing protein [Eggerthellaceae bacterium]